MNLSSIRSRLLSLLPEGLSGLLSAHDAIIAGGCLRDIVQGKDSVKDVDIFTVTEESWRSLNGALGERFREVGFTDAPAGRINVRKFELPGGAPVLDSIGYFHVFRPEHVVETFDFTVNMLWYDPRDGKVKGSAKWPPEEIVRHILERRLVVGDNLWWRATFNRAMTRYGRFRKEGYTIDRENMEKYRRYAELLRK